MSEMPQAKKRLLLELIYDLVNSYEGTWREKKQSLLDEAASGEPTALEEFASWWD